MIKHQFLLVIPPFHLLLPYWEKSLWICHCLDESYIDKTHYIQYLEIKYRVFQGPNIRNGQIQSLETLSTVPLPRLCACDTPQRSEVGSRLEKEDKRLASGKGNSLDSVYIFIHIVSF